MVKQDGDGCSMPVQYPPALFFILMWFVPESPRWLAKESGKSFKAHKILAKIGGAGLCRFRDSIQLNETLESVESKDRHQILKQPGVSKLLVLGIVMAVFQQWCGINVIFNYAQEIFANAGYSVSDILFNIVITGSVNLIFTFVGMFTVDKLGRKALMLFGAGGLAGIFAILEQCIIFIFRGFRLLIMVVTAIACYAMSLAPVTWVILSEIFPNRMRGIAMSIATFALWAACFVLTYTFPLLNKLLKASGTFWLIRNYLIGGFLVYFEETP